jgi:hypothetical protein
MDYSDMTEEEKLAEDESRIRDFHETGDYIKHEEMIKWMDKLIKGVKAEDPPISNMYEEGTWFRK